MVSLEELSALDLQIWLRTGLAAVVGFSNVELLGQATDYFARAAQLNPFTHTWSLGVE